MSQTPRPDPWAGLRNVRAPRPPSRNGNSADRRKAEFEGWLIFGAAIGFAVAAWAGVYFLLKLVLG